MLWFVSVESCGLVRNIIMINKNKRGNKTLTGRGGGDVASQGSWNHICTFHLLDYDLKKETHLTLSLFAIHDRYYSFPDLHIQACFFLNHSIHGTCIEELRERDRSFQNHPKISMSQKPNFYFFFIFF